MTCDRVRSRLEEYFDGELAGQDLATVEAHVAGCEECSAELESLESESALFARYDRGVEPSPEFWDGVLARLADEPAAPVREPEARDSFLVRLGAWLSPGRLVPLGAACAAIVVAVAIGVTFLRSGDRSDTASNPPVVPFSAPPVVGPTPEPGRSTVSLAPEATTNDVRPAAAPRRGTPRTSRAAESISAPVVPTAPVASALPAPVVTAERQYLEAIAALSKDVDSKGGLDAKLKKPLDDIDRNIVVAKQAVEKDPKDTEAVMNMLAAYDRKVEVLQSLARYQVARNR